MSKELLSAYARRLLAPLIRLNAWALRQHDELHNDDLRQRFDTPDPASVKLYGKNRIAAAEQCTLGRHVAIHDARWDAAAGLTIGSYVHFGPRVTIVTRSHNYEGDAIPYDSTVIAQPVVIEDHVWIGADCVIAPGTHIEEGCIIAMGTTVSGRVPRGAIIGASRWRKIKTRDLEHFDRLKAAGRSR